MPRIKEYTAKDASLSEDATGFAAFETAGRRIGPLYDQAGNSLEKAARARANDIKDRLWPWDMLALEQSQKAAGSTKGGNGQGGAGFKLAGADNHGEASSAEHYGTGSGSPTVLRGSSAGALGKLASGLATKGGYHNQTIDTGTGLPVQPDKWVLDQGQLVRIGSKGAGDINGEGAAQKWGDERAGTPVDTTSGLPRDYGQIGTEIGKEELDRGLNPVAEMTGGTPASSGGWWSGITGGIKSMFTPNTSATDDGSSYE